MGLISRAWKVASVGMTVYAVYQKVKELNQVKVDFYSQLSPSEQQIWKQYFGDPTDHPLIASPLPTIAPIAQLKAGT